PEAAVAHLFYHLADGRVGRERHQFGRHDFLDLRAIGVEPGDGDPLEQIALGEDASELAPARNRHAAGIALYHRIDRLADRLGSLDFHRLLQEYLPHDLGIGDPLAQFHRELQNAAHRDHADDSTLTLAHEQVAEFRAVHFAERLEDVRVVRHRADRRRHDFFDVRRFGVEILA